MTQRDASAAAGVGPEASGGGEEFEREPVPPARQLGLKGFVGQYVGEHVAGTELMIGPLFLVHGVSAADLVLGLLVGNALAVLSWMLLTAPIATRARLTLYFQLEKICGRKLVPIYNVANGIMFCFLAGAMVTVSATALGVWFNFEMPRLSDVMPNSVGWVVAVFAIGSLISLVAAYGYESVARFANWAAPWMVLVFVAFGIVGLKQLGITEVSELWGSAKTVIWKGGEPLAGRVKFTLWHVMFFAWFCNMAMHIGMGDLSIYRFARKSWYAISSGAGMFVGHFMAWLSASILYAVQLKADPTNVDVLPGPMAYSACGIAGLLCVIAAGWTTANPTIYRAGLAFQSLAPRASRFKVTLITGLLATITGVFPGITMKLLDFVALYGLILMPMGAVIFVDFWLMPRFGLSSNYAQKSGIGFNWAAGLAWIVTLALCTALVLTGRAEIFFVGLPGWFVAAILYVVLSKVMQKAQPETLATRPVA